MWKARSATLTNSCQPFLLSHLLSACESEFFYLKTPPYQKSKHIYSAGKTCQICFKLPTPVRQGSNSLPPRHGWQTNNYGLPWREDVEASNWSAHYWEWNIFVIFYTILHRSFIICNFSKCGGGGGGDGGGVKTWCRIEHLQHLW